MTWVSTGLPADACCSTSVAMALEVQRHRHRLAVGEVVQRALERELPPHPALLDAAVGHPRELAEAAVDLHPAGLDGVGGPKRARDVTAPDEGRQPVVAVVRHPDHLLL